jgi:hypothetical protein
MREALFPNLSKNRLKKSREGMNLCQCERERERERERDQRAKRKYEQWLDTVTHP